MEKKTILTLDQVKEIEKTYPTPFHIYDEKGIRENARALKHQTHLSLKFYRKKAAELTALL